jgi:hypothetical protein
LQEYYEFNSAHRLDEHISKLMEFMEMRHRDAMKRVIKPKTLTEAQQRLEDGFHILDKREIRPHESNDYGFYVESEAYDDLEYVVDLQTVCCSCADYAVHARPCKHIFACMLKYDDDEGVGLPDEIRQHPFELIHSLLTALRANARFSIDTRRTTAYPAYRSVQIQKQKKPNKQKSLVTAAKQLLACSSKPAFPRTAIPLQLTDVVSDDSSSDKESSDSDDNQPIVTGLRYLSTSGKQIRVDLSWRKLTPKYAAAATAFSNTVSKHLKSVKAKRNAVTDAVMSITTSATGELLVSTHAQDNMPCDGATKKTAIAFLDDHFSCN